MYPFLIFSTVSAFDDFSEIPDKKAALIWSQQALRYDWSDSNERQANVSVPVTPHMLNNGSVWAHCFFTMAGYSHDPDAKRYTPAAVIYKLEPLNVYRPKPKLNVRKNLVTGEYVDERVVKEMEAASIVDDAERAKMIQVSGAEMSREVAPFVRIVKLSFYFSSMKKANLDVINAKIVYRPLLFVRPIFLSW